MVRSKDYKYIIYPISVIELLYDLRKNPLEITDVSKIKKYNKYLEKMRPHLANEMNEFLDPLNLEHPKESYKLYKKKNKKPFVINFKFLNLCELLSQMQTKTHLDQSIVERMQNQ